MPLTKQQKNEVVEEVKDLLNTSKMTVVTKYQGTTVKALQDLRRQARDNGTKVKVVKNRLVKQALQQSDQLKDVDVSSLEGMLMYAFNSEDEVAPAQVIAGFAKTNPTLEFVGAISADGKLISAMDVKALAALPGKNQLIAGLIHTLNSPMNGVVSALSGNLHGLLQGLEAKASN
jgi:large subunit ribosomal protein L10